MSDPFCGVSSSTPTYPLIAGYFPPIGYAGVEPATTIFYLAQSSFSADIDGTACGFYDSANKFLGSSTAVFYTYEYSLLIACTTPVRSTVGEKLSVVISWDGGITVDPTSNATFTYTGSFTPLIEIVMMITIMAMMMKMAMMKKMKIDECMMIK